MEYQIVTASGNIGKENVYETLQKNVNEEIKNGWIPQGGICVFTLLAPDEYVSGQYVEVWQAMTKEEKNDKII